MNALALSGWRHLRAALPGQHAAHDTANDEPNILHLDDLEAAERQRTALATISLGWGDCFPTAAGFFSWDGSKDPRVN